MSIHYINNSDVPYIFADAILSTMDVTKPAGRGADYYMGMSDYMVIMSMREKLGDIPSGKIEVTPSVGSYSNIVLHTTAPCWDGSEKNKELLKKCYENAIIEAERYGCKSIMLPMIGQNTQGIPEDVIWKTSLSVAKKHALNSDIHIYIAMPDKNKDKNFEGLQEYFLNIISSSSSHKEMYEPHKKAHMTGLCGSAVQVVQPFCSRNINLNDCELPAWHNRENKSRSEDDEDTAYELASFPIEVDRDLEDALKDVDDSFSVYLMKLIEASGKNHVEIYRKANMDRKLFSKLKNNRDYKPKKNTAIALAISLELSLDETQEFIGKAGYILTHSSPTDIIVEYFIKKENYDIFAINEVLYNYDLPLLGL